MPGCVYCHERRGNPCPYCGTYWPEGPDPTNPKPEDGWVSYSLDEWERELKAKKRPRPPLTRLAKHLQLHWRKLLACGSVCAFLVLAITDGCW